jgi:hypothetical protein
MADTLKLAGYANIGDNRPLGALAVGKTSRLIFILL